MNHIARNHVRKGLRVPSNTVPAVTEVCPWHTRQCISPRYVIHGSLLAPQ